MLHTGVCSLIVSSTEYLDKNLTTWKLVEIWLLFLVFSECLWLGCTSLVLHWRWAGTRWLNTSWTKATTWTQRGTAVRLKTTILKSVLESGTFVVEQMSRQKCLIGCSLLPMFDTDWVTTGRHASWRYTVLHFSDIFNYDLVIKECVTASYSPYSTSSIRMCSVVGFLFFFPPFRQIWHLFPVLTGKIN